MIEMPRRILQRRCNILILQIRIIAQDFRTLGPGGQHVEDIGHADSLAANARPAAEHLGV
ncbi:hypothetical protein D3C83_326300 [compost metagenome]